MNMNNNNNKEAANAVSFTLDKKMYQRLNDMFNSSDEDNHLIARDILYKCDEKSYYWLYKLADKHMYHRDRLINRRLKKYKEFAKKTNFENLMYGWNNLRTIVNKTISLGLMTQEIFDDVIDDVLEHAKSAYDCKLIDISVEVNKEYKDFHINNLTSKYNDNK